MITHAVQVTGSGGLTGAQEPDAMRSYTRRGSRVGLVVAVLAGLVMSQAIRGLIGNLHLRERGVATVAQVTSISCYEKTSRYERTIVCDGDVAFRTEDGREVTHHFSSQPEQTLPFADVGHETMRVLYDPQDPSNVALRGSGIGLFDLTFFWVLCAGLALTVLWGLTLGARRRRWAARVREHVGLGTRTAASVTSRPGMVSFEPPDGSGTLAMRVIRGQALPPTGSSVTMVGGLTDGGIAVVEYAGLKIWPASRLRRGLLRRSLMRVNLQGEERRVQGSKERRVQGEELRASLAGPSLGSSPPMEESPREPADPTCGNCSTIVAVGEVRCHTCGRKVRSSWDDPGWGEVMLLLCVVAWPLVWIPLGLILGIGRLLDPAFLAGHATIALFLGGIFIFPFVALGMWFSWFWIAEKVLPNGRIQSAVTLLGMLAFLSLAPAAFFFLW